MARAEQSWPATTGPDRTSYGCHKWSRTSCGVFLIGVMYIWGSIGPHFVVGDAEFCITASLDNRVQRAN